MWAFLTRYMAQDRGVADRHPGFMLQPRGGGSVQHTSDNPNRTTGLFTTDRMPPERAGRRSPENTERNDVKKEKDEGQAKRKARSGVKKEESTSFGLDAFLHSLLTSSCRLYSPHTPHATHNILAKAHRKETGRRGGRGGGRGGRG